MSVSKESLMREIDRLLEFHGDEVRRLRLQVVEDRIAKHQDTWEVPVVVEAAEGDAGDLTDLLRTIRRSLESKTKESVSVVLDEAA
jgi:hypothetical protein